MVVDAETGILVDGWEPSEYAAALLRILGDPVTAAAMARAAVSSSEQFSWVKTADRLLELYDGLRARPRRQKIL